MKLHILGVGGTFMGSLAALAKELNFTVSGSDQQIYPPMSTQLEALGIKLYQGYGLEPLAAAPDLLVVGNVMTRGMPIIEALLNDKLPFLSGPKWLAKYILQGKHVIAVSGTHGKTTTTSMLAWILEVAGKKPGFLIGGVANNFSVSARLGEGPYFVVEADEYDTAFFDKRSKFLHYRPETLIINNIEFDHADIFPNLAAIQTQFHHLLRSLPGKGLIIYPNSDPAIKTVLDMGCWTPQTTIGFSETSDWYAQQLDKSGSVFEVYFKGKKLGTVNWDLLGQHNISNALAAMAAANQLDIKAEVAISALCQFKGVKRRLEVKGCVNGITIYDDFAHHPTAIKTTLAGLRAKLGEKANIVVALDLRSNTMRAGHHELGLRDAFNLADELYFFKSADIQWQVEKLWQATEKQGGVYTEISELLLALKSRVKAGDHLVFMSNGGFANCHARFLDLLSVSV